VPHLKTLGKPPSRVALVSFYVWDCSNKKESSYSIYGGNYVYRTTSTRKRSVNAGEIDVLATELLDSSVDTLIAKRGAGLYMFWATSRSSRLTRTAMPTDVDYAGYAIVAGALATKNGAARKKEDRLKSRLLQGSAKLLPGYAISVRLNFTIPGRRTPTAPQSDRLRLSPSSPGPFPRRYCPASNCLETGGNP
jgi:hypothetical protein